MSIYISIKELMGRVDNNKGNSLWDLKMLHWFNSRHQFNRSFKEHVKCKKENFIDLKEFTNQALYTQLYH